MIDGDSAGSYCAIQLRRTVYAIKRVHFQSIALFISEKCHTILHIFIISIILLWQRFPYQLCPPRTLFTDEYPFGRQGVPDFQFTILKSTISASSEIKDSNMTFN